MGSVLSYIECPRCKQENCIEDYYYHTGELYTTCSECGYLRVFRYKRDSNGKFLKKDETKGVDFGNLIVEEIHVENPYGAYTIESTRGGATCGVLETEDDYQKFVSEIVSFSNQENDIKKATVSKLVGKNIEKEVVFERE